MIPHHVDRAAAAARGIRMGSTQSLRVRSARRTRPSCRRRCRRRGCRTVRSAAVHVAWSTYGFCALAVLRVRRTHGRDAARIRGIPSAPGVRAEVLVERPVLLHDHDDVLDLVDARSGRPRRTRSRRTHHDEDQRRHDRKRNDECGYTTRFPFDACTPPPHGASLGECALNVHGSNSPFLW